MFAIPNFYFWFAALISGFGWVWLFFIKPEKYEFTRVEGFVIWLLGVIFSWLLFIAKSETSILEVLSAAKF